ncbi:hypothetical protein DPMN_023926 [Dreissena polymorpha]|uniref:Uncharacterized protein n=1 Tax=Dreissena polymorpha TaxID=45954 RepID=A0A9D4RC85_DREPO|nr:hypothetical protein DPMN_023926 [Dreissena polymorpha]
MRLEINLTSRIFKLNQDIIGTNLLTKFHENQTINVASRHFCDRKTDRQDRRTDGPITICAPSGAQKCRYPGGHVFQRIITIFKRILDDWTIIVTSRVSTRKTAPPPGGLVFQPSGIIFKLIHDINGTNFVTKIRKDSTNNVASRVLIRFYYSHIFQRSGTIFKLKRAIIQTNDLTKFHEDWTINVTSRVLKIYNCSHIIKTAPPPDIIGTNVPTKFHEDLTKNKTF